MKDTHLSKSINTTLKSQFCNFFELNKSSSIRKLLKEASEQGLVEMQYNELRNDKTIFSFYISYEAETAYLTDWEMTFAFNKKTGNLLTIDSLISKSKRNAFVNALKKMQRDSMSSYKKEILAEYKMGDIEKEDYDYAIEHTKNNCWEYFSVKTFKLYSDSMEIRIDCEFPNLYKSISPPSIFTLPTNQLNHFIKLEYIN
ncbi:MAG: hypothetical protein ABJA57_05510 [Ginsengibacter sp.]